MKNLLLMFQNHTYSLIWVWTILMIIQMYVIKTYIEFWRQRIVGDKTKNMQWNIENKDLVNTKISEEISKRLNMLEEMEYIEWLKYNNDNPVMGVEHQIYNFYVFERVKNTNANYNVEDRFILRANKLQTNLGLTYEELLKQANYAFLFSIFSPNRSFLHTIFESSHYKTTDNAGINIYSYFTVDPDVNRPVKSNAVGAKFSKEVDGELFEGVMYVPYSLLDVEEQYANKYYDFMSKGFIVFFSVMVLIISIMLASVSPSTDTVWLPYAFMIASIYYLITFMNTVEGITNLEGEENRLKSINDGVLSISFLSAVNVFIVQSMRNTVGSYSYYEAAILFMVALVLLLFSLYRVTNFNRIDEMRVYRVSRQFAFNLSIYVNVFILLYYSSSLLKKGNALASVKKSFLKMFDA